MPPKTMETLQEYPAYVQNDDRGFGDGEAEMQSMKRGMGNAVKKYKHWI